MAASFPLRDHPPCVRMGGGYVGSSISQIRASWPLTPFVYILAHIPGAVGTHVHS